jgi:hypothetical protein
MFAHVINSTSGKTFRYKSRVTREMTDFYAERGLIRIHYHGKTGHEEYETVAVREFLLRAQAINDSLRVKQPSDEKLDQQRLVETMIEVAKQAQNQGDPIQILRANLNQSTARGRGPSLVANGVDLPPLPQAPADKPPVPLLMVAPETSQPAPSKLILPGR